ncbi:MAG: RNA polymerase sigma factor [Rhodanobacter sp.]
MIVALHIGPEDSFMNGDPNDRNEWSKILGRIRRATGRYEEAEDLLHQAYERLEKFRSMNVVTNASAFLVKTAVNIGIDEQRKDHHLERKFDLHRDGLGLVDPSPIQDEVLATRQRLDRVQLGLNQLSPRTREIFLLHRLEGLKYREIAEQVGVSQSAVEKHIAKAALFLMQWTENW